jgi:hypothetical protein
MTRTRSSDDGAMTESRIFGKESLLRAIFCSVADLNFRARSADSR